jgi:hypothetical protein
MLTAVVGGIVDLPVSGHHSNTEAMWAWVSCKLVCPQTSGSHVSTGEHAPLRLGLETLAGPRIQRITLAVSLAHDLTFSGSDKRFCGRRCERRTWHGAQGG